MKALTNEVETVDLSLVIEIFELDDIFPEGKVGLFEARDGHRSLVNYPNAKDELAEVLVVLVRENAMEDARAKAIDVQQ